MFKQWRRKKKKNPLPFHCRVSRSVLSLPLRNSQWECFSLYVRHDSDHYLSYYLSWQWIIVCIWFSIELEQKAPKKALMPPTPAPRKLVSSTPTPSSTSSTNGQDQKMRVPQHPMGQSKSTALHGSTLPLKAFNIFRLSFQQISFQTQYIFFCCVSFYFLAII